MADRRLDRMRVVDGEGQADSLDNAVSWLIGLLSDSDPDEYARSVLERARETEGQESA
ncbi:MAG TPA: hypothetical protein PLO90_00415 [Clostridia bacterium]|jgi:hypothetical protein|nr:hypothetical protein [Clostridia bacterium]HPY42814.1 hypothetical protein [Clostridia bacterium]HQA97541.1 hypothetical protein [Clostridia bacterium]HQO56113.1 hypothetical protein [Clostridia bacterium]HUM60723.1 hypothetical protein [Clostridia bacterium]